MNAENFYEGFEMIARETKHFNFNDNNKKLSSDTIVNLVLLQTQ